MPIADLTILCALQKSEFPYLQALTVASLSHLSCAYYVLLRIAEPESPAQTSAAHTWLAHLAKRITVASPKEEARSRKHQPALNVAFTREGLQAFGLTEAEIETFSFPFWQGMNSHRRNTILGDQGPTAPSNWAWGGPASPPIHVMLLLFAPGLAELEALLKGEEALWTAGNLTLCVPPLHAGQRSSTREHFGFLDGVGQPVIKGTPNRTKQKERTGHETVINAGEFVLGYTNQDLVAPPSPIVGADRDAQKLLPPARHLQNGKLVEDEARHDFGFNGTYLVFRQLQQHVSHFWDAMLAAADGDKAEAQRLAAKVIGRWPSGAPFTFYPDALTDPYPDGYPMKNGDPQVENDFAFRDTDLQGIGCPIGAHIRRANPRDSLGINGEAALSSARRHRIIRRGRVYGPEVRDAFVDDGVERGLFFICLCADIERQFEFVQQTWINNPNFSGLNGESDPLLGRSGGGADVFSIQQCPVRQRVSGLSDFVTLRGGAYFFLPSVPAVRFLASLSG